jgi:hypothetical protein
MFGLPWQAYCLVAKEIEGSERNEILGLMVSFLGLLKRIEKKKIKTKNKRSMNHSLKLVLIGFFTWVLKNGGKNKQIFERNNKQIFEK